MEITRPLVISEEKKGGNRDDTMYSYINLLVPMDTIRMRHRERSNTIKQKKQKYLQKIISSKKMKKIANLHRSPC